MSGCTVIENGQPCQRGGRIIKGLYCFKHYSRFLKYGDVHANHRKVRGTCPAEEESGVCGRPTEKWGVTASHIRVIRRGKSRRHVHRAA